MSRKSRVIVVDTGGFIENAKLEDYGEKIYTVAAVINEIRDKNTRRRLQVLPYEICYREPSLTSTNEVTFFDEALITRSKDKRRGKCQYFRTVHSVVVSSFEYIGKSWVQALLSNVVENVRKVAAETGDLRSLSTTDIKVIALTYELHRELAEGTSSSLGNKEEEDGSIANESDGEMEAEQDEIRDNSEDAPDDKEMEEEDMAAGDVETKDEESEQEEEFDDDSKWVTPENISSVDFEKHFQTGKDDDDEEDVPTPLVSCLTTDFAMQNVMLKMKLSIRGVNGRLVRSIRSFVLWCFSCFSHTLDQSKVFCPKCGNNTLRKISASVNTNGKLQLHFSKKFQIRNKGLNKQVDPKYQGGKYSFNKIYSADQPMPHQRPSKKALQREAQSDGIISSDNPFALRDLSSRAARIGMNKRNRTRCRK